MRTFKCRECGKELSNDESCLIVTVGRVVESCGGRYMTENREYICEGCQ